MEPSAPAECTLFAADVGTWDAEVLVRPMPGAPPQESRGVMSARLVGNGRWLITDFRNETSGFEGHGVYGWDPGKKRYVSTWVDTMRPFLVVGEGTWDEAARTMTYVTKIARSDGSELVLREVTEKLDADTQVFHSYFPMTRGEFEMMTVTYRRRP